MFGHQQELLLNWLIQGAAKWFGEGLGEQPQASKNAFKDYFTENGRLGQFVGNFCENCQDFYINAGNFRQMFDECNDCKTRQNGLIVMENVGSDMQLSFWDGFRTKYYLGLKLSC
jgi:hypothetical protein